MLPGAAHSYLQQHAVLQQHMQATQSALTPCSSLDCCIRLAGTPAYFADEQCQQHGRWQDLHMSSAAFWIVRGFCCHLLGLHIFLRMMLQCRQPVQRWLHSAVSLLLKTLGSASSLLASRIPIPPCICDLLVRDLAAGIAKPSTHVLQLAGGCINHKGCPAHHPHHQTVQLQCSHTELPFCWRCAHSWRASAAGSRCAAFALCYSRPSGRTNSSGTASWLVFQATRRLAALYVMMLEQLRCCGCSSARCC